MRLVRLNAQLGEYFGTDHGVLVADIEKDSPLGLKVGDVILAIGERRATTPERVRRILASYGEDETIVFRILRKHKEINVSGHLPD